jgi:beta-N-acetylhexosaminidase
MERFCAGKGRQTPFFFLAFCFTDKEFMNKKPSAFINRLLARMSVREKIGQCFTLRFMDGFLRPDVVKAITQYNCAGLRLVPWEREGVSYKKGEDRCFKGGSVDETNGRRLGSAIYRTPGQYADLLNECQELAMARKCGIPLHFAIDQEGDGYNDFSRGGVNLFPSNMGLTATKNPRLVFEVYKAIGRQLKGIGVTFVHSPVLDVNVDPANPEINIRSFSDDPNVMAELALQAMRGLHAAGVIAVPKHFPGRGNSAMDSHYELCYYPHNAKQMEEIDLLPYRKLIPNGLKSVMTGHTVYPALGDDERPSSVSPVIINDLLRKQMGFDGVVTTDSITMLGLMNKYGLNEACVRALKSGNDLVLYRGPIADLTEVYDYMEESVRSGKMEEAVLDQAITRVLKLKLELGLFKNWRVNPKKADAVVRDPKIIKLADEIPSKTAILVKRGRRFPLKPGTKVLVAEQLNRFAWQCNDPWYHPGMLYEYMAEEAADSSNVDVVECTMSCLDDLPRIKERIAPADVVVATSFYCRTATHNLEFIKTLVKLGKPVIVITNNPYLCKNMMMCDTVLLIFSGNPHGLKACRDILYGRKKPTGSWPLNNYPQPR